jgi:hypothetical protein
MADAAGLDAVLAALPADGTYQDFVRLMVQAERGTGSRPSATFETVFVTSGHPFDYARVEMLARAERSANSGIQVLRLVSDDGPWRLLSFPTRHAGVFHVASGIPTTDRRWQKVGRWLDRSSRISRCFLNHGDFAAIGDSLARYGDVEVVHAAGRSHRDSSSTNRGFPALVGGSRPNHRDAITEFERTGSYVRSLRLQVSDRLAVHLRRVAGATYYSGDFRAFDHSVLDALALATAARRALVTGRERRRAQPVAALSVVLPADLFRTREDTGALIDLVQGMADMSMAVFHRNPYLHFAMTDETDGSNFDVMVTVSDRVSVYPGFRASAEALARVTQRIAEAFGARHIERTEPAGSVSLADLVGA